MTQPPCFQGGFRPLTAVEVLGPTVGGMEVLQHTHWGHDLCLGCDAGPFWATASGRVDTLLYVGIITLTFILCRLRAGAELAAPWRPEGGLRAACQLYQTGKVDNKGYYAHNVY